MLQLKELKKLKNQLILYSDTLNLPSNITFGFEIEIENVLLDRLKELIKELKIKDIGFDEYKATLEISNLSFFKDKLMNGEVSTGILSDSKEDWINLQKLLILLKEENAIITKSCGCHVNIGTHILEDKEEYWRNFLLLWKLYEREIFKFSTGEYNQIRSLKYINPISFKLELKELLKSFGNTKEYLNNLPNFLFNKEFCCRNSLSLKKCISFDYEKNNVIEFRTPNGTLDLNILKNYTYFFVNFLLTCKKDLDIDRIVYDIENDNHDLFKLAELLFDNEIDKNNFLIQSLKINKVYMKKNKRHLYSR